MPDYAMERIESRCRVVLKGDLTAAKVSELQAAMKTELASGVVDITVDLINTVMIDSAGIGLLIAVCNSVARKKGSLVVVNAAPDIIHLLHSMRLTNRLEVRGREVEKNHG